MKKLQFKKEIKAPAQKVYETMLGLNDKSTYEQNQPARFVSIRHYGFLDGDTEITTGEDVEKWAGGYKNYSFVEDNGVTTVTVDLDSIDEYLDFFQQYLPEGLGKTQGYFRVKSWQKATVQKYK